MRHPSWWRAALGLCGLVCAGSAFTMIAGNGAVVGRFDFGYEIQGQGIARPLQVFDDGEARTYFQFRDDDPTPVVLEQDGRKVLIPEREGPFTVVSSLARDFTLVLGESRSQVRHLQGGNVRAREEAAEPLRLAALGAGLPAVPALASVSAGASGADSGSYALPLKGDVVEWRAAGRTVEQPVLFVEGSSALPKEVGRALTALAAQIGSDARVTVIGRDDQSLKEGLAERRAQQLRDALVRAGVPAVHVVLQVGDEQGEPLLRGKSRLVASTIRWTPLAPGALQAPTSPARSTATAEAARSPDLSRDVLDGALAEWVRVGKLSPQVAERIKADRRVRESASPIAGDPSPLRLYELRVADGTVGEALARWAQGSGYELVWDAPRAPLTGSARIEARDFLDAVRTVIVGLRQQGYPVKAMAYADGVLQVRSEP